MFDEKPKENINSAISKVNKGISVIKKLRPRSFQTHIAMEIITYNLQSFFKTPN